eukprot:scaffold258424_cov37-Tisochrysis_lutea.AAC.1
MQHKFHNNRLMGQRGRPQRCPKVKGGVIQQMTTCRCQRRIDRLGGAEAIKLMATSHCGLWQRLDSIAPGENRTHTFCKPHQAQPQSSRVARATTHPSAARGKSRTDCSDGHNSKGGIERWHLAREALAVPEGHHASAAPKLTETEEKTRDQVPMQPTCQAWQPECRPTEPVQRANVRLER